jgi:hypothetical protein
MGPTALLPLRRKFVLGIFITHKNPPSSVGSEPATEYPVGPVASTLTTRPPRAVAAIVMVLIRTGRNYTIEYGTLFLFVLILLSLPVINYSTYWFLFTMEFYCCVVSVIMQSCDTSLITHIIMGYRK